jgi:outer membrane receptor for ferrienterochelin and colicin
MIRALISCIACVCCVLTVKAQSYTISGYISDSETKEIIIGASIFDQISQNGCISNKYGFFSLKIPQVNVRIVASFMGYDHAECDFTLTNDTTINIQISPKSYELEEVTVKASGAYSRLESTRLGVVNVPIATIKNTPTLLGESDLMKSLQFISGVQNTSEGKSDLSVRGGTPDQNLALLDGIPVYNTNHVFGFLSIFNTDALKNVTLYKSGFPARFGGRLSSVIDITTKDGNKERIGGSVTIGLLAAKVNLEGPVVKDRTSFTFSARRSFADLYMGKLQEIYADEDNTTKTNFFFYDLNAKLHHKLSDKTSLYLMAYNGRDKLENTTGEKPSENVLNSTAQQDWKWGNTIFAGKLNHVFRSDLFVNTTLAYNHYQYATILDKQYTYTGEDEVDQKAFNRLDYNSRIKDYTLNMDAEYIPLNKHYFRGGVSAIYHNFNPEVISRKTNDVNETINNDTPKTVSAYEFAFYAEDDWDITEVFKLNYGARFSMFNVNSHTYAAIDPRLSLRFLFTPNLSVKAGYSQMQQYIHLLSNNSLFLQTDLWVPLTDKVEPMSSKQYSTGLVWALPKSFEFSVEGYYKNMTNVIEYKDGASFSGISTGWENKIEAGIGRSFGVEFSLEKKSGDLTGTLSYALAKTERKFDEINFGEWYPAKFDRRHNINVNLMYKLSSKIDLMASWTFSSGDMLTIPYMSLVIPDVPGIPSDDTEETQLDHRNNYRMGAYHRLDLGMNYYAKRKGGRYGVWNFSIYNAYNRMNPFKIYSEMADSKKQPDGSLEHTYRLKQVTLFPVMPSISYTYNF